jgi:cytochrome c556
MQGKLRKFLVIGLVSGALGLGLATGPASANEAAVKYRQAVMKALGGHMGSVVAIVKGQVPNKDDLEGHAQAIAAIGEMAEGLFPEDSMEGADTRALPDIWNKPEDFAKAVSAFESASANFAEAAGGGDMAAVGAALGQLGQSCGGCHKPFRGK